MLDSHALVLVDTDGVIRMWNGGAERLFGYGTASALGQTLDLIIAPDYREQHWAGFRAAMRTGKPKLDQPAANLPAVCSDGRTARVPARLVFLRDANGAAVGALGIFGPSGEPDPALPSL